MTAWLATGTVRPGLTWPRCSASSSTRCRTAATASKRCPDRAGAERGIQPCARRALVRSSSRADPWKALIADALEQLEHAEFLARDGGRWSTDPSFATGKRLSRTSRKGKHRSVGVILCADEREARGVAEKRRMEVTSLAASLREDGPGLRPLDRDHVAALEQSMRDYGYRPEFPIWSTGTAAYSTGGTA